MDRNEVLLGFHRYVPHPTSEDVAWWVRAFPEFADEIRSLARAAIGSQALASLAAREEDLIQSDLQCGSGVKDQIYDSKTESN